MFVEKAIWTLGKMKRNPTGGCMRRDTNSGIHPLPSAALLLRLEPTEGHTVMLVLMTSDAVSYPCQYQCQYPCHHVCDYPYYKHAAASHDHKS